MNKPLFVFYEDKLAQSENNFGPHVLAIACLIDARGNAETRWELGKRILHLCKNGVSKLIADATLFQDATRKVLAPDEDRIRGELALVPATTASEVVAELGRRTNTPEQQIVLIVRNMDDVARNAAAAMGAELSAAKPSRQERDRCCHALAATSDRSARDRFLDSMPSFKRLIEILNARLHATARPP